MSDSNHTGITSPIMMDVYDTDQTSTPHKGVVIQHRYSFPARKFVVGGFQHNQRLRNASLFAPALATTTESSDISASPKGGTNTLSDIQNAKPNNTDDEHESQRVTDLMDPKLRELIKSVEQFIVQQRETMTRIDSLITEHVTGVSQQLASCGDMSLAAWKSELLKLDHTLQELQFRKQSIIAKTEQLAEFCLVSEKLQNDYAALLERQSSFPNVLIEYDYNSFRQLFIPPRAGRVEDIKVHVRQHVEAFYDNCVIIKPATDSKVTSSKRRLFKCVWAIIQVNQQAASAHLYKNSHKTSKSSNSLRSRDSRRPSLQDSFTNLSTDDCVLASVRISEYNSRSTVGDMRFQVSSNVESSTEFVNDVRRRMKKHHRKTGLATLTLAALSHSGSGHHLAAADRKTAMGLDDTGTHVVPPTRHDLSLDVDSKQTHDAFFDTLESPTFSDGTYDNSDGGMYRSDSYRRRANISTWHNRHVSKDQVLEMEGIKFLKERELGRSPKAKKQHKNKNKNKKKNKKKKADVVVTPVKKYGRRWMKKRKREIRRNNKHFEMTCDMMVGLRTVVLLNPRKNFANGLDTPPKDSDFSGTTSAIFPQDGSDTTPPHGFAEFEFKDYAGPIFARLRAKAGLTDEEYLASLASGLPYLDFVSNSKSGSFFFYTHDKRFMIKSQPQDESKFLRNNLKEYYQHIMKYPNSLISQIYGMHRVRVHKRKVHFIIMANVFKTHKQIHKRFDLKGSTVGRAATRREKLQLCPVLKDLDFADTYIQLGPKRDTFLKQLEADARFLERLNIMDYSLLVGIHQRNESANNKADAEASLKQMMHDADTKEHELMPVDTTDDGAITSNQSDSNSQSIRASRTQRLYGLSDAEVPAMSTHQRDPKVQSYMQQVAGVEPGARFDRRQSVSHRRRNSYFDHLRRGSQFKRQDGGVYSSHHDRAGPLAIYYFGIIDILQNYNVRKKAEHFVKSFVNDSNEISAVSPQAYADRFIKFLSSHVI
jgi:Phosphatidylinositol-4-phosphate 5-Kinase